MSKISTYEVAPIPKLADKLIGTSVGGEIEDATYNFTLQELLDLFLPNIPANNLQGVLDYGNTATQDINLFGTITTTNLDVTGTANLFITYLNEETHIVGGVYDSDDSVGTNGQVLTSTGDGVAWVTLPPIFTPNLQQVLTVGNTSTIGIILDATLQALNVDTDDAVINTNITIDGTITDGAAEVGTPGQVLSSTATGVEWVDLPAYTAISPLLFNSVTGIFSIQQASNVQGGYLSAADWINFDGKQPAGNYITALSGEASASGPGSANTILSNAAVIGKVLTGFNPTPGTINAGDSILVALGKAQSQINALVGGVIYQGTWNASANVPALVSSVGVQGHYYIVNVAGNTNLNGITDWQVGDWAIFSESTWQKVDNTESVSSVNGFTGAVSLTTDNIPEGITNLYFLNSRARQALSFLPGSGAYDNTSGAITIPTNNNQILNGAGYITLASLSASAPLSYNNLTGGFAIQKSDITHDGYLSSTDWNTFNSKQSYLGGTGLVKSTAGTITYITDNSSEWNIAYDRSIVSAAVTGTSTKTLTLTEQDGNTIQASWTDLDTGLTSVGVSMPSAFTVTNSPLTANGVIGITGAGTNLQYIDGTGALQTFPGLTGFVPYTGANQNLDLGTYGLLADYIKLNTAPTSVPTTAGTMSWNDTDGTMDIKLKGGNVTLQVGEENVTRVVNKSGIDLLEENYQVVRARKVAEGGAAGQRIAVVLAQGNSENNSTEVLGLVTETINANQEGFVTCFGEVKEINTTGSLQGETWVDGDILYLSSTVAGGLTNIRPVAPNHSVIVGYVTYAHAVHGKIYMAIDTGYELGELHNVYAPSPTNTQSIYWNTANSRYELNTIAGILGYTPADDSLVVHLAGTETITGAKTFTTKVTINTGGTDNQLQLVGVGPSLRLSNAVSGATINGFVAMAGGTDNYIQGSIAGDMCIGNQNNGRILFGFGAGTATQKMSLDSSGNAILAGGLTLGGDISKGSYNYVLPSASGTIALISDLSGFVTSVTASGPLSSSGGVTPNITIQQAGASQSGYLSSTDWNTFNNKQAAGNYITSLTGEATASGPGAASITLNNASVTGKVLTGVNITGGSISATDSMLTAFGKLQNQINGLIGSTIYQGTWNASTNTPALTSSVGTRGWYYIVSVAGSTNLNGITDWQVGDWAIFDGTAWQKVDNTDAVVSVNGQTGAVSLTTDNIPEGVTNLYFTNTRARNAITLTTTGSSGVATYSGGVLNIPNYGDALSGYVPYTGATTTLNMNNKSLTNAAVLISNFAVQTGSSSTVGGIFQYLNGTNGTFSPTTGYTTVQGTTDYFSFAPTATDRAIFWYSGGLRGYTLPSSSGTLALTSDIPSLSGYVQGSGTISYHAKFTGTSSIGNSMLTDDGTTLQSIGATRSNLYLRAASSSYYGQLAFTNGSNGIFGGISYNNSGQWMQFETNNSEWVRLSSSGNLMLNTTSVISSTDILTVNVSAAGNNQIVLRDRSISAYYGSILYRADLGETRITSNDGGVGISFYTNVPATEKARITPYGRLGIGTTDPVYGNISVVATDNTVISSTEWGSSSASNLNIAVYNTSQNAGTGSGIRLITRNSGASVWGIYNISTGSGSGDLVFGNGTGGSGQERYRIRNNGNIVTNTNSVQNQTFSKTAVVDVNGYVEIDTETGGGNFNGIIIVSNSYIYNANIRTQAVYTVLGRGTAFYNNNIGITSGPTGSDTFNVTCPSTGIIRITNTGYNSSSITITWFGNQS